MVMNLKDLLSDTDPCEPKLSTEELLSGSRIKGEFYSPDWLNSELKSELERISHKIDSCVIKCNQATDHYEFQSIQMERDLYLEYFEGMASAIEALLHERIHFSRTDSHYGVCTEDERYLIKFKRTK